MTHTDTHGTDVAPTALRQLRYRNLHLTASGVALGTAALLFWGPTPTWTVSVILAAIGFGVPIVVLALTSPTDRATGTGRRWGTSTRCLVAAILTLSLTESLVNLAYYLTASQEPPHVDVRLFTMCLVLGVIAAVLIAIGLFTFPWRTSTWHRSLTHVVATTVLALYTYKVTLIAYLALGSAILVF